MFTDDLAEATGLLEPQLEQGLKVLVSAGHITADTFSPLRWLLRSEVIKRRASKRSRRGSLGRASMAPLGRWSLVGLRVTGQKPEQAQYRDPDYTFP